MSHIVTESFDGSVVFLLEQNFSLSGKFGT